MPAVRIGNVVSVAGQVPMVEGKFGYQGKFGKDYTVDEGKACARRVATPVIGPLKEACGGDLDRVHQAVKLKGFVNCAPELVEQPHVINGAQWLTCFYDREAHRTFEWVFNLKNKGTQEYRLPR